MATRPRHRGRRSRSTPHRFTFEGGGGKGLLFPGALIGLVQRGILRYRAALPDLEFSPRRLDEAPPVQSLSGASAGAITALLVSCGYTPTEILLIMELENKRAFFDVDAESYPAPEGPQPITSTDHTGLYPHYRDHTGSGASETRILAVIGEIIAATQSREPLVGLRDFLARAQVLAASITSLQSAQLLPSLLAALVHLAGGALPQAATRAIRENSAGAARSLLGHYGLFAGTELRRFLNCWITVARYRITPATTPRTCSDVRKAAQRHHS